jgi:hypothetical protein
MRNRKQKRFLPARSQRTGTQHIGDKFKNESRLSASPSPRVGGGAPQLLDGSLWRRRQDAKIDPPPDAAQVLEPPSLVLRHAPTFSLTRFGALRFTLGGKPRTPPRCQTLYMGVYYLFQLRKGGSFWNKGRNLGGFGKRRGGGKRRLFCAPENGVLVLLVEG